RKTQVALPVHPGRRVRLGLHAGARARGHAVAGKAAQTDAVGESQWLLLRARSRDRAVPDGQSLREANLESGLRRDRPADQESRVLAETDGRHRGLARHAGRNELVSTVVQPPDWSLLHSNVGKRRRPLAEVRRRRMEGRPALYRLDHTGWRHYIRRPRSAASREI